MKLVTRTVAVMAMITALAACTTLSEQDRALLASVSQNAEAAKQLSAQANASAQQAFQAAQAARASAAKAAADAKAANDKADRIYSRSLRK